MTDYYRRITDLNIRHYTDEVPFYSKAPLRPVEACMLDTLPTGAEILDVGCGSGRFSVNAALKGFRLTGLDITPAAVNAARERALRESVPAEFQVADMSEIPFPSASFDFVFCPRFSINALATFERRRQAVHEMVRVVRPGGRVFVESFNYWYLGKGPVRLIRLILRDAARASTMLVSRLRGVPYAGLRLGDVIYPANKVPGATDGYTHLASIGEIRRWAPDDMPQRLQSIPELMGRTGSDIWRFNRYSLWLVVEKRMKQARPTRRSATTAGRREAIG